MAELHVGEPRPVGPSLRFDDRICRDVDRHEASVWASLGQSDRLGTDAAPSLEHRAPAGVDGVGVQQVDQRSGLSLQALVLARLIAVYVDVTHGSMVPYQPLAWTTMRAEGSRPHR